MTDQEMMLLKMVETKCAEKPEFITHVINTCVRGMQQELTETRHRVADMETAAVAMTFLAGQKRCGPKVKTQMQDLFLSKMEKYQGRTYMKWNDTFSENVKKVK